MSAAEVSFKAMNGNGQFPFKEKPSGKRVGYILHTRLKYNIQRVLLSTYFQNSFKEQKYFFLRSSLTSIQYIIGTLFVAQTSKSYLIRWIKEVKPKFSWRHVIRKIYFRHFILKPKNAVQQELANYEWNKSPLWIESVMSKTIPESFKVCCINKGKLRFILAC